MGTIAARLLRVAAVALTVGMCLLLIAELGMQAWYGLGDIRDIVNWRDKTSPLDQAVINDLCSKFALPPNDARCRPGAVVYAPDFFGTIRDAFEPKNSPWAKYDDVQEMLGQYQFRYERPVTTGQGLTYFVAHYDLRGDRVFPITMFFYADGRLWRLIADVGD